MRAAAGRGQQHGAELSGEVLSGHGHVEFRIVEVAESDRCGDVVHHGVGDFRARPGRGIKVGQDAQVGGEAVVEVRDI
ncbi:hypothetical protein [Streptomyces sp. NPDC054837]